jgi:alpha-D-ribose 1-methylphosphonate 5-triphosphate synthase subunit PhnG
MAALSKAEAHEVADAWAGLPSRPAYRIVRAPETGLAMVRGRAGGDGAAFNLGEMTMTRAVVRLGDTGPVGFAYVAGRDRRHAELAAAFDALLQAEAEGPAHAAVETLRAARAARVEARLSASGATRVDFFTVAREAGQAENGAPESEA